MAVEYPTLVSVILTDTFEEWRVKTNAMIEHTEAAAQNVGNLNFLNTDGKSTIVDALNEVDTHTDTNTANIGVMSDIDNKIKKATLVDTLNQAVQYHEKYTTDAVAAEAAIRLAKDNSLQFELDATQTAVGLTNNGTYSIPTGSNYMTSSSTVMSGMLNLDSTLKSTTDLLEVLIDTVGANAAGLYNYSGNTVHYLSAENNGNAKVRSGLIQLDGQIKINTDSIASNLQAINASSKKIESIIKSVGLNSEGVLQLDNNNRFADGIEIKENIKRLDDQLDHITTKVESDLDTTIAGLVSNIDTKADKVDVGDINNLEGGIGNTSNIVAAINSLYTLVKPLLDGDASTPYVRKIGDTMTGSLEITNGELYVNGSQNNHIKTNGDVIAYFNG